MDRNHRAAPLQCGLNGLHPHYGFSPRDCGAPMLPSRGSQITGKLLQAVQVCVSTRHENFEECRVLFHSSRATETEGVVFAGTMPDP